MFKLYYGYLKNFFHLLLHKYKYICFALDGSPNVSILIHIYIFIGQQGMAIFTETRDICINIHSLSHTTSSPTYPHAQSPICYIETISAKIPARTKQSVLINRNKISYFYSSLSSNSILSFDVSTCRLYSIRFLIFVINRVA